MEGKYSIELFRDGVEGAGIEKILVRHDSLTVARALYKVAALNCSERLIMLCDKARVLVRSDRPETMPEIRLAQKGGASRCPICKGRVNRNTKKRPIGDFRRFSSLVLSSLWRLR
jgi:hypothetical protein